MSAAKLADSLGVTRRQVERFAHEGVAVRVRRGRYDLAQSKSNYEKMTEPVTDLTYNEARRRRAVADEELTKLRPAKQKWQFVSRKSLIAAMTRIGRVGREAVFAELRHLPPKLAAMTDQAAIGKELDAAASRALHVEADAFEDFMREEEERGTP